MKKEHRYNQPEQKKFRQGLRRGMTTAEIALWLMLRGKQLDSVKFRRQYGVGPFILDFYCPAARLGIEVDGQGHFTEKGINYDQCREEYLWRKHGIRLLRFENKQIFEYPDFVLNDIRQALKETKKEIEDR
ncbi:endonuclease domain-containing protein [Mediterranea massiliensis]|uniref:endonuclease domain-containing protein n=1 Tax=Mediterranea massiliensis TaxID=1841865 RepID=UPI0025A4BE8F|nr:endonuclease domain-containing protein [Mediterranea massiliensis]MDM8337142.1 endonuclease domain-containing protein [Mediterranea massiliensis]